MNYDMTTPCPDCPFRKVGGIRLMPGRIREIGGMMLSPDGGSFPCHKTVEYDDDGEATQGDEEQHCAGALIFAESQGNATQLMRIMERLGVYDHRKLAERSLVWDSLAQWLKGGAIGRERSARKGSTKR